MVICGSRNIPETNTKNVLVRIMTAGAVVLIHHTIYAHSANVMHLHILLGAR